MGLLAEQLQRVLRQPAPAIAALVVGLLLGLLLGRVLVRDATALPVTSQAPAPSERAARGHAEPAPDATPQPLPPVGDGAAEPRGDADQRRIQRAIRRGRGAAARYGTVQVAVMMDGWADAVTVPASPSRIRAWSVSKVFTAVTLLGAVGAPDADLDADLAGALQRSENCPQRSLVLRLQETAGGIESASERLQTVLQAADAKVELGEASAAEGGECVGRLPEADRRTPALRLGTSEWSVTSAVRFMHALRRGIYGGAGTHVLEHMSRPKKDSREAAGQYTAPPSWGAGSIFAPGTPYKAGWGGSTTGTFVAEQIAAVDLGNGRWAAIAVAYHPAQQPATDDPGAAGAAQAFEAVLTPIKSALEEAAR